eukprot:CAMPEP_0185773050 /NCGR_PEP_ID=MMETSP1174-20130828/72258_1 /TAXON_ID=35687 /ORGANISM="Dictyocha speculum, Strain CCMP1381" /LENGTH=106 /DNA_ID=CAMNT_0028459587 /DNA_START=197 /DNA_END=517 /DNA_ORIENTATION=+
MARAHSSLEATPPQAARLGGGEALRGHAHIGDRSKKLLRLQASQVRLWGRGVAVDRTAIPQDQITSSAADEFAGHGREAREVRLDRDEVPLRGPRLVIADFGVTSM